MFGIDAMSTEISRIEAGELTTVGHEWERRIGEAADQAARQNVFDEHLRDLSSNTLRAYKASLQTFCDEYLPMAQIHRDVDAMQRDPMQWAFLTYGIVKGFREWMLQQGYSLSTVQQKLSTVKLFAKLAAEAGALDQDVADMVGAVKGPPAGKRGVKLNEQRTEAGVGTRRSSKKQQTLTLTNREIYAMLEDHPDTPQGRRDRVLCCLGLEHGMRASELSTLRVEDVDLEADTIRIYRQKTGLEQLDGIQTHSRQALQAYIEAGDAPESGPLLRGSRKGGQLRDGSMTPSRISTRVKEIAKRILDRDDITAHDLRATFATWAHTSGTDRAAIRSGGGWKTMAMVDHYIKAAGHGEKDNARVKLV